MKNIHKITNIALIFTLIGVVVCQELYALRVPMNGHNKVEEASEAVAMELMRDTANKMMSFFTLHNLNNRLGNFQRSKNEIVNRAKLNPGEQQKISTLDKNPLGKWKIWLDNLKAIKAFKGFDVSMLEGVDMEGNMQPIEEFIKELKELQIPAIEEEIQEFESEKKEFEDYVKWIISFKDVKEMNNVDRLISLCIGGDRKEGISYKASPDAEDLVFERIVDKEGLVVAGFIENLIENSIEQQEYEDFEMLITAEKDETKWIKMEFSDKAPGMSKKILSHIFDKDFTTKELRENEKRGQGLYLTREYLKLKGGRIQVDTKTKTGKAWRLIFGDKLEKSKMSESDRAETGTTFTVWLPVTPDKIGTPKRLSIDEAREILLTNLKGINEEIPLLSKACKTGAEVLEREDIDNFKEKGLPEINRVQDMLKERVDRIRTIPLLFGFGEPEIEEKLDSFLSGIAEEFGFDKIVILLGGDFNYSYGFTEKELFDLCRNDKILPKIYSHDMNIDADKHTEVIEVLRRSNVYSALKVKLDTHFWDIPIKVFVCRSKKKTDQHGLLTEEDIEKIRMFIKKRNPPWNLIKEYLSIKGYKTFSDFMVILKHNSAIARLNVATLPYLEKGHILSILTEKDHGSFDDLVSNLKDFGKNLTDKTFLENGTFLQLLESGTDFKTRNITQHLNKRILSFSKEAESKGLEYIVDLIGEDLFVEHCDLNLLNITIDNLIQNAIKYTPKGKIKVTLSKKLVEYKSSDPGKLLSAVIEVEDTGIGIPEEEDSKIFNRGYRASNVGDIQGTGIGLDAVSTIILTMSDGELKVESKVGKGTKVSVYLPLASNQGVEIVYGDVNMGTSEAKKRIAEILKIDHQNIGEENEACFRNRVGCIQRNLMKLVYLTDAEGKKLVGYILYEPKEGNLAHFRRIFIKEEYRQKGLFGSLVTFSMGKFDGIIMNIIPDEYEAGYIDDAVIEKTNNLTNMCYSLGFKKMVTGEFCWIKPGSNNKLVIERKIEGIEKSKSLPYSPYKYLLHTLPYVAPNRDI